MAKSEVLLGEVKIGKNFMPYMIAEIGINHNGDINIAKRLIDAAFACEWDNVKFQKRVPDICVPEEQKNKIKNTPWGKMTYIEYKNRMEFQKKEYDEIDQYCKMKPITWSASPWDLKSLDFLLEYDIPYIKISSALNREKNLLREACKSGKTIIASTGMSNLSDVDDLVNILEKEGNGNYILMHTNSQYPTPVGETNVKTIQMLRERYGCIVGYSGHEQDLQASITAAVLGAKVIERHVTISHNMMGSDHKASLEVQAMAILKKRIYDAILSLGDGIKRISEKELEVSKKLRFYESVN